MHILFVLIGTNHATVSSFESSVKRYPTETAFNRVDLDFYSESTALKYWQWRKTSRCSNHYLTKYLCVCCTHNTDIQTKYILAYILLHNLSECQGKERLNTGAQYGQIL